MGVLRGRIWRDGQLVADGPDAVDLHQLSEYLADPALLVWFDLCGPASDYLTTLAQELELDSHAVEDALATGERPKATRHARHTFVTMYATGLQPDEPDPSALSVSYTSRLELFKISAFVLHNALITVRSDDGFGLDPVLARWDENADLIRDAGPHAVGALLHGLLDTVVDGHFETIQALDDTIEALEDLLFDETVQTRTMQRHVYRARKELVGLRRVVLPMREVVNGVLRHRAELKSGRELDGWYDDLYDHVLRAAEWTESLRDMLTTLFETNLSLQDAHLNMVMKKLAGWAAIIAVPTAVTGWFGQNVPYWGFSEQAGVWQSVVLIVLASVGLYLVFRRRDWI